MIRLYIANLGKYNEAEMVGDWIELPYTDKEIRDLFVRIKLGYYDKNGKYVDGFEENGILYEEFAIHDYETNFDIRIGEYDSIEALNELAEELENLSFQEIELIEAIIENDGCSIREALSKKDNISYFVLDKNTILSDETNLAYVVVDEAYGGISELSKEMLERYFDYEAFGRDLAYDYTFSTNGIATSNH